jgi:quercetin dioxygenase-like cupin family protein
MSYQVVHADEIGMQHGVVRPLSTPLGVGAFKLNRLELPAGAEGFEHDHDGDREEEVYAIVAGSGTLRIEGEEVELRPGHFVYCSPDAQRQMVAGPDGLTWIGIGAPRTD